MKKNNVRAFAVCSVCPAIVGAGGRKTAPALCARCYQRERRDLPPAAEKQNGLGLTEQLTVAISVGQQRGLEQRAAKAGKTVAAYVREWLFMPRGT